MPSDQSASTATNRILVKRRPGGTLRAAGPRLSLRLLDDTAMDRAPGVQGDPRWFLSEPPEGAPTPWDLAHSRVERSSAPTRLRGTSAPASRSSGPRATRSSSPRRALLMAPDRREPFAALHTLAEESGR